MKLIIRILFMTLLALPAVSKAQITAFEKFADMPTLSYTYISTTMLKLASKYGKSNDKDSPLAPIIDKLTSIQEISTTGKGNGTKLIKDVKDIARCGNYELLVSIDNHTEQRFVYFKPKDSKHPVASVIIIKSTDRSTKVIGITGKLDIDDLTSIIH